MDSLILKLDKGEEVSDTILLFNKYLKLKINE